MKSKYYLIIFLVITGINCTKDQAGLKAPTTGAGGSMARFAIQGNYLYTVDREKLKVYSLDNPSNPILKSTVQVGFEIETIYPFSDKLFIGSTSVVHIFSVTDPEHPEKLSSAVSPNVLRRCDPVVARDNVAYATLRTNGPCGGIQSRLAAFDISDILHPEQTETLAINEPYGLGYADSTLYVCDRIGLNIFSISDPLHPVLMSNIGTGNWYFDVIPHGKTLICWVSDGLMIYDITDERAPALIKKVI